MESIDERKEKSSDEKNQANKLKKLENLNVCPYCQNLVEFVWVHGHYQCPACKSVVIGCCGDE
ncbi:MAG: hypothetical protein L0Y79_04285 [Chlorobi bacterium]|nr:hypothetical protein [Chlorobiota bacterium]MCI0716151.1 hypothetical protein [Chlorobiota bacterium]